MAETNLKRRRSKPRESGTIMTATEAVRVVPTTKMPQNDFQKLLLELAEKHFLNYQMKHFRAMSLSSAKMPGLNFADMTGLIRTIEVGLRWSVIDGFLKRSGLNQAELAEFLGVPDRTLARRREKGALTKVESERFARLVEIFNACMELFDGNSDAAREWLTAPAYGLNNVRPFDFAKNEFGAREVRNLIGRLQDGVFS